MWPLANEALDALAARLAELRDTVENFDPYVENAELRKERNALREALAFYSDEARYDYDQTCCPAPPRGTTARWTREGASHDDVLCDLGERARAALARNTEGGADGG